MAENEPDPNDDLSAETPSAKRPRRRKPLTPELRRFLGPGRSWRDREAAKQQAEEGAEEPLPSSPPDPSSSQEPEPPFLEPGPPPERVKMPSSAAAVMPDQKLSRVIEMQTVALIIGSVIVLAGAFYAGTKVRILKNALNVFVSRNKPELPNYDSTKFPGLSADELVEQALAAERLGNWHEAVARLITAKKRNLLYRDLLFHAGKLCYDHGDFDSADRLLERAIVYGDQVDTANYLRGLIAVGRNDLSAAERFFEAAATAEPFTPGYFYYWGDALRRDQRPNEAVKRYEQAAARTVNEQDAALCHFKARMAKAETADNAELQAEIEKKSAAGPLPVDWLLTEAALRIRAGELPQAVQLIEQARMADQPRLLTLFSSCTSDMLFTEASRNHPEIAAACRADAAPSAPPLSSSPSGTP